jgi:hypothetical protein
MKEDGAGVYKAAAVEKKFVHMVKNSKLTFRFHTLSTAPQS